MLSWTDNAAAKRESDEQVACACRRMTVALFPAVHHSAAETHTFTHTHMQCCAQLHSYTYNTHAHTCTAITCVSSYLKQVHRLVSSCLRIVNSRWDHSVAAEGVMGVHNFFCSSVQFMFGQTSLVPCHTCDFVARLWRATKSQRATS